MTRVILVRHGQTLWNALGKYQGHTDVPLNEVGIEQARKVAKRLAGENISAVYASDLSRAKDTAKIIAQKHGLEVETDKKLREMNFGLWEGKTYNQIQEEYPQLVKVWISDPQLLQIPQGETFSQVQLRAIRALKEIIRRHNINETIVVVAHGLTIISIICAVLEIDLKNMWKIKQGNTGISIIEFYDNNGILTLFNDTHHLSVS